MKTVEESRSVELFMIKAIRLIIRQIDRFLRFHVSIFETNLNEQCVQCERKSAGHKSREKSERKRFLNWDFEITNQVEGVLRNVLLRSAGLWASRSARLWKALKVVIVRWHLAFIRSARCSAKRATRAPLVATYNSQCYNNKESWAWNSKKEKRVSYRWIN